MGKEVLLVEADLRTPSLSARLHPADMAARPGWARSPGLGGSGWPAGLQLPVDAGESGSFDLVPGRRVRNVARALTSGPATRLFAEADEPGTAVVVLAPAVLAYADALALADRVDGVVVVCDPHAGAPRRPGPGTGVGGGSGRRRTRYGPAPLRPAGPRPPPVAAPPPRRARAPGVAAGRTRTRGVPRAAPGPLTGPAARRPPSAASGALPDETTTDPAPPTPRTPRPRPRVRRPGTGRARRRGRPARQDRDRQFRRRPGRRRVHQHHRAGGRRAAVLGRRLLGVLDGLHGLHRAARGRTSPTSARRWSWSAARSGYGPRAARRWSSPRPPPPCSASAWPPGCLRRRRDRARARGARCWCCRSCSPRTACATASPRCACRTWRWPRTPYGWLVAVPALADAAARSRRRTAGGGVGGVRGYPRCWSARRCCGRGSRARPSTSGRTSGAGTSGSGSSWSSASATPPASSRWSASACSPRRWRSARCAAPRPCSGR